MRVVVGETAETVTALSLSCEKGLSCKISIYFISSACLMGIISIVKKYQQRVSESAGDVWGGRGTVRMFCLPAVRCLLVDRSNVQAAMQLQDQVNRFSRISLASPLGCLRWGLCQLRWAKPLRASRDPILR